jgi:hypothetical protein
MRVALEIAGLPRGAALPDTSKSRCGDRELAADSSPHTQDCQTDPPQNGNLGNLQSAAPFARSYQTIRPNIANPRQSSAPPTSSSPGVAPAGVAPASRR